MPTVDISLQSTHALVVILPVPLLKQLRQGKSLLAWNFYTLRKKARMELGKLFYKLGLIARFIGRFFKEAFRPPLEGREILNQFYNVGYRSFLLITFTSFLAGIVFTK